VSFDWLNVGHSNNVVLYREHLRDDDDSDGDTTDDGISLSQYDNESVPEMAGIHEASEAPSATSAELYGNGTEYHSNIHLGELTLGRNPTVAGGKATYSLGVAFNDSLGGAFDSQSDIREIVEMARTNYALYRIDLEYKTGYDPTSGGTFDRFNKKLHRNDNWYPLGSGSGPVSDLKQFTDYYTENSRPDIYLIFDWDGQGDLDDCGGRSAADFVDQDERTVPTLVCTDR